MVPEKTDIVRQHAGLDLVDDLQLRGRGHRCGDEPADCQCRDGKARGAGTMGTSAVPAYPHRALPAPFALVISREFTLRLSSPLAKGVCAGAASPAAGRRSCRAD